MDSLLDFPDWLSITYKIFEFLFFMGMDIACLVIAIKGYRRGDLKRTWLFLIWVIVLGMVSYVFTTLFFDVFSRIWGYEFYGSISTIVLGINSIFYYVRSILFLLMIIWMYRKK